MNAKTLRAASVAALVLLTLGGCHRDAGEATVGQKLDKAIDRTQEKLAAAGQSTSQAVSDAGQKTSQAVADAGEKTSQKLAEVGDKTQAVVANAADKVVEKTGQAVAAVQEASVGPVVADTAITASIKTDFLKDPDLSVLKIDVDTRGGVVTLNGLAGNEAARTRAEKLAGAIKGVREVRNFLVVKRA